MDMTCTRNCDTCRHDLGGGCCRINLEAECGKGDFEAWEPKDRVAEASSCMAHGFSEFCAGMTELLTLAFQIFSKVLSTIDWSGLAELKEADPDLFNWTASGPIRRVQLRRARALMEDKNGGVI